MRVEFVSLCSHLSLIVFRLGGGVWRGVDLVGDHHIFLSKGSPLCVDHLCGMPSHTHGSNLILPYSPSYQHFVMEAYIGML